jgi:hypothetical protein
MSSSSQLQIAFDLKGKLPSIAAEELQSRPSVWQQPWLLHRCRIVLRQTRRVMSVATALVPFSYLVATLVDAGVFRSDAFDGLRLSPLIHMIVQPGRYLGMALFSISVVRNGWNLWLLGIAAGTFILRARVLNELESMENSIDARLKGPEKPRVPISSKVLMQTSRPR